MIGETVAIGTTDSLDTPVDSIRPLEEISTKKEKMTSVVSERLVVVPRLEVASTTDEVREG